MVVFHIISSIDIGGAEQVAFNIARYSSSDISYHIVEVIKSRSAFSNKIKADLKKKGIKFHTSPFKHNKIALLLFWSWFWLPFLVYRPQILHSHTEVPDFALWIFRRFSWTFFWIKSKYVRTIHNTQLWNKWKWVAKIVEPFYQRNHCNIAISENTHNLYKKNYGGDVARIIHNGLPEIEQCKLQNLDNNKINILFAGRFEPQKGTDILVGVIQHFFDNPKYKFYIIGSGSEGAMIKGELGHHDNIVFKDKIYGLNKYIGAFDYLFIPSRFEGLALLPIEASLAKTPSIISNIPGLRESFPSEWPLKSKSNSIDEYVSIIKNLQKGLIRDDLGLLAYNFVKNKYSVNRMISEYEDFYNEILSNE